MRCLVTGASGHIGSYLVRLLLARGYRVAVLLRPASNVWRIKDLMTQVEVIRGDLASLEAAALEIRNFAPEVVFHLAWEGVGSSHRNDVVQLRNLDGSLKLLQVVAQCGCRRYVYLGSQAEYGPYAGVLSEDLPVRPVTFYGVTKLSVGLVSQKLCETYNMDFVWLRLLATYGPMDDPKHLIPSVITSLLGGMKPALTSGEQCWDYLYIEDAARAIAQSAVMPAVQGIYNLGSGECHSVRSIAEHIRDLIDPSLPLGFGEVYSQQAIMHLQADVSLLQQATGWVPQVSLEEGLQRTVNWYKYNLRSVP